MKIWHKAVIDKLLTSGLFKEATLVGAKVRATLDEARFLDIHINPAAPSYSYALIDLRMPYPGDKRLFGWDDYPHEGVVELEQLENYPHHYQRRADDGSWIFESSPMCGDIEQDMEIVIATIKAYLQE